jgi:hypothetical protein
MYLNIFSPLQIKINHVTEIKNMCLFLRPIWCTIFGSHYAIVDPHSNFHWIQVRT